MTTMNDALKPCANCGSAPSGTMILDNKMWLIECHECGATTKQHYSEDRSISAWNRRANTPESSAAQGAMGDEYLTIDGIDAVGSIQLAASYVTKGNVSTILAGQLTRIADYLSKVKRLRPSDGERATALREAISAIDALQRTDSEVYEPHWVIENRDRFNGAIRICVNTVRSLLAVQSSDSTAQPRVDLTDERAALIVLCRLQIAANENRQKVIAWDEAETPKRILAELLTNTAQGKPCKKFQFNPEHWDHCDFCKCSRSDHALAAKKG